MMGYQGEGAGAGVLSNTIKSLRNAITHRNIRALPTYLQKYDLNNNGRLDQDERQELLNKFDKDGNGRLDESERQAFTTSDETPVAGVAASSEPKVEAGVAASSSEPKVEAGVAASSSEPKVEAGMAASSEPKVEAGVGGESDTARDTATKAPFVPFQSKSFLRPRSQENSFSVSRSSERAGNGDGNSNAEEKTETASEEPRKVTPSSMEGSISERRKAVLAEFDKDGDGKLNEEERLARKSSTGKQGEAQPTRDGVTAEGLSEKRKKMLAKFDEDGDGKLSTQEKNKMIEWAKEIKQGKGKRSKLGRLGRRYDN